MKDGNLNTNKDFTGWESRTARAVPETFKKDGKSVIVEAVITTEQPAIVADWERWELVREVLLMDGVVLPDTKQVPLLDTHSRWSTSDVKGSIRNLRVEKTDLVGDVYFWSKAEDEISQVEEGHLTDLSAGYKTFGKEFTVEIMPGKKQEINGKTFENNFDDGLRMLIRTKWEIKEGSLVPIGADSASKFRSDLQPSIKSEDPDLQTKLNEFANDIKSIKSELKIKLNKETQMNENEKTLEQIQKEERERIQGIDEIAGALVSQKLYKGGKEELAKFAAQAKTESWSVDKFRQHVWGNLKNEDITQTAVTDLGMSKKGIKALSIGRALAAMVELRGGNLTAWDKFKAGAEKEAIDEATKQANMIPGFKANGMVLPLDFFKNPDVMRHSQVMKAAVRNHMKNYGGDFGKRASDGVSVSDATYLIGTENMFNEFIDVLRNLGVAGQWGVRMISGAKQNISVPKKTSTGTFHWVAESGTGTATDFVIGQLTATPHNGWASMKYTRQAALQSVPALEALIIDDILKNVITGRDSALINGAGTYEPDGLLITSGIGSVVGASFDLDALIEFWTDVKTNNINTENLRFVMNALVAGGYLGMLFDYASRISAPPIISEQSPASTLIYGDGSEAWMIDWGIIDLLVNPYKDDTGDIVITAFTSMDVLFSRVTAFSVAADVS